MAHTHTDGHTHTHTRTDTHTLGEWHLWAPSPCVQQHSGPVHHKTTCGQNLSSLSMPRTKTKTTVFTGSSFPLTRLHPLTTLAELTKMVCWPRSSHSYRGDGTVSRHQRGVPLHTALLPGVARLAGGHERRQWQLYSQVLWWSQAAESSGTEGSCCGSYHCKTKRER